MGFFGGEPLVAPSMSFGCVRQANGRSSHCALIGTGGHLHNIGVVLRPAGISSGGGDIASTVVAEVLRLEATQGLQDCGLLSQWGQSGASLPARALRPRLWELGTLVGTCTKLCAHRWRRVLSVRALTPLVGYLSTGIVDDLYTRNPPEQVAACLKSITTYVRNILKVWLWCTQLIIVLSCSVDPAVVWCLAQNPTERKFQSIKLSNAVLQQTVLRCRGGMQLLCFGPGAFSLREDGGGLLMLRSAAADLLAEDRSASFRASYERWLARFVDFLAAVATINASVL